MAASATKRTVTVSIGEDVLRDARRLGVNLSAVAETALRSEIERRGSSSALQERMDRSMEYWNARSRDGVSIADEFGTL